jgi:hypothetical protein
MMIAMSARKMSDAPAGRVVMTPRRRSGRERRVFGA